MSPRWYRANYGPKNGSGCQGLVKGEKQSGEKERFA
jgi:hypothetical protein